MSWTVETGDKGIVLAGRELDGSTNNNNAGVAQVVVGWRGGRVNVVGKSLLRRFISSRKQRHGVNGNLRTSIIEVLIFKIRLQID